MLPSLFVPHGAPTFALDPGTTGGRLAAFAASLPRPRAIVVASAHWHSEAPMAGGSAAPETIHDYWGFPEPLYDIRYAAPGAPALAERVAGLLSRAGHGARIHPARGLDHAVWIPLRLMFPDATVPVVPLSIQPHLGPEHHYRLGLTLAPLLAEDVLVVGSGNLTHSLRDYQLTRGDGRTPTYVREFADWIWQRLESGELSSLLAYRRLAPEAARAHPSEDHLLPLFVAMGAAGAGCQARRTYDGVADRVLAMDAFAFLPLAGAPS